MNFAKFFIKPFFVEPSVDASQREWPLSLTAKLMEVLWLKLWKIKNIGSFSRNMKVGEDRNFGISQESMMHISVFCGLPAALKFYRSHWKVKKVFLNVQNMSADNFNLVKSLRKTCKLVYFFTKKMNALKGFFQNISHFISKILFSFNNTYFKGYLLPAASI